MRADQPRPRTDPPHRAAPAPGPVAPGAATRAAPRPGPAAQFWDALATRPAHAPEWIAMYHSVTRTGDDPYRITVTPERLDGQLRRLRRRGLRGVSARELVAARARGRARGLVALTFDDGYADFLDHALPVLRHWGCGATLFVLPGRLGGDNAWDPLGVRKPLLTADGVRAAAAAGIEIGSHGLTHLDLTRADDATLRAETLDSRTLLRELTGTEVTGFCYPYGTVDARVVAAVRAAGYRYGCAIAPGPLAGELALPRVHIGQEDTGVRLELKRLLSPVRRPMPSYAGAPVTPARPAPEPARGKRPGPPSGATASVHAPDTPPVTRTTVRAASRTARRTPLTPGRTAAPGRATAPGRPESS